MRLLCSGYTHAQPLPKFSCGTIAMDTYHPFYRKDKVVVVMGATGTGKSRLSIDLGHRFFAEIINADKMQVYKGLDIVTNKVTEEEQRDVPHHLLGEIEPGSDFFADDFKRKALNKLQEIVQRRRLPIIAGGSNSYIEALVSSEFRSRYDCCFMWVDVSLPVLHTFVSKRVDQMVEAGLVDEVRSMFDPEADYTRGIRRAIGVPEMDRFLRAEAAAKAGKPAPGEATRARLLEAAIDEIKANTCKLSCCQLQKIHRLRTLSGWNLHRLDATEAFSKRGAEAEAAWERLVVAPSLLIVRLFLENAGAEKTTAATMGAPIAAATVASVAAVLAAASVAVGGAVR